MVCRAGSEQAIHRVETANAFDGEVVGASQEQQCWWEAGCTPISLSACEQEPLGPWRLLGRELCQ